MLHKDDEGKAVINPASLALFRGNSNEENHMNRPRKARGVRGNTHSHMGKGKLQNKSGNSRSFKYKTFACLFPRSKLFHATKTRLRPCGPPEIINVYLLYLHSAEER